MNKHKTTSQKTQFPDREFQPERRSPLEVYLNASKQIRVMSAFKDKTGAIRMPVFRESSLEIVANDPEMIKLKYPHASTYVLEATREFIDIKGKRVLAIFSGGNASGGNNVLAGMYSIGGKNNEILGGIEGPDSMLYNQAVKLKADFMQFILSTGGFDAIQTSRTKLDNEIKMRILCKFANLNELDGIAILGGDDSNTNAADIAEYFAGAYETGLLNKPCIVVGVPKTIDGDLRYFHPETKEFLLPQSFGFATAADVMSNKVGNLLTDAAGQNKYWFNVKAMGRTASHLTLETALQTHPHFALISEEIEKEGHSLNQIVDYVTNIIIQRAVRGKTNGVGIIPEGIIEGVQELKKLINELSTYIRNNPQIIDMDLAEKKKTVQSADGTIISNDSKSAFASLPDNVVKSLFEKRDAHGNLQVSLIPSHSLIDELVKKRIKDLQAHPENYINRKEYPGLEMESIRKKVLGKVIAEDFIMDGIGVDDANKIFKFFTDNKLMSSSGELTKDFLKMPKVMFDFLEANYDKQFFPILKMLHGIVKFEYASQLDFIGYDCRSGHPNELDSSYSFALGQVAMSLMLQGHSGSMASVKDIMSGGTPIGIPIAGLIHTEVRNGKATSVIEKYKIDPDLSKSFKYYKSIRERDAIGGASINPGSIQHDGPLANGVPKTVLIDAYGFSGEELEDPKNNPQFDLGRRMQVRFK